MNDVLLIGLGYQIGVGKDTVADILYKLYDFRKMRFADALKEATSVIFGWPREKLDDQTFKATEDPFWGLTPRTVLQRLGTEGVRNTIGEDVWVKALKLRIDRYVENCHDVKRPARIVIPDVRFPNEVQAINNWGGKTVCILRPNNTYTPEQLNAQHDSEKALDDYYDWDYIVHNTGTVEDLVAESRWMLDTFKMCE